MGQAKYEGESTLLLSISKDRLRRYPEDMQSYYYLGISAEFIGKVEESYQAFLAGYKKYKSEYYRVPMEHLKQKRRVTNGRFN